MHALRNIHAALLPNGLLVDTQPVAARPVVIANGAKLGELDLREWVETIREVDERVGEILIAGLYELTDERNFVITSTFDDGPDCLETTRAWQGTSVAEPLTERLALTRDQVTVEQQVLLRVLRRGDAGDPL